MEIKFIGQGLDPESDNTAGDYLINSLISSNYSKFNAFVAFVSLSGLNNIVDQMIDFVNNRGGEICLYVGVNLHATSKEALEKLLGLGFDTYIVYTPSNIIYHPKIYAFEGDSLTRAIVGSSNLTASGLFQNMEASVCIDFESEDEQGIEFLSSVYEHFNNIIDASSDNCQRLTQEILDLLVETKVVLPEATVIAKTNKVNNEFSKADAKAKEKLLEKFARVKPKRPPKGSKKVIKEEIKIDRSNDVSVVSEVLPLPPNSMWIETGQMTGGSKNQLDMSKKGKRNGVLKPGSVSFFGLDPDDTSARKNINIHLGGEVYFDNPVFYAEGNSNWRIQLKGVTSEGLKLTTISKPSLGYRGGFIEKILLFTKIDDDDFSLQILDKEYMESLIENSLDWAKGGNETTGRAYGFI